MLTLEPTGQEDLELLFQLNKQLIDTYEDIESIDYDRVLTWVRKNLEHSLPRFTRVLYNGQTAAFFCLTPVDGKTELDSLFVLSQFQNQGIGTEILRKCQDEVPTPLFLYVFQKNTGAIRLYEKLGFRITQQVGTSRYIMEYQKQGC